MREMQKQAWEWGTDAQMPQSTKEVVQPHTLGSTCLILVINLQWTSCSLSPATTWSRHTAWLREPCWLVQCFVWKWRWHLPPDLLIQNGGLDTPAPTVIDTVVKMSAFPVSPVPCQCKGQALHTAVFSFRFLISSLQHGPEYQSKFSIYFFVRN